MAQITMAKRRKNYIEITYDIMPEEDLELCIAGNSVSRNRQLNKKGPNCQVSFRFKTSAEAKEFQTVYFFNGQQNRIGDAVAIQEESLEIAEPITVPEKPRSKRAIYDEPILTKEMRLPKQWRSFTQQQAIRMIGILIVFFILTIWIVHACTTRPPIQALEIYEAFFQDAKTITVHGRILWDPKLEEKEKSLPENEILLYLLEDGQARSNQKVLHDAFHYYFSYSIGSAKNYSIGAKYRGKFVSEWSKEVHFKPGFPIGHITKLEYRTPQSGIQANVTIISESKEPLELQLVSEASTSMTGAVIESCPITATTQIEFKPVTKYQNFLVILQNPQSNAVLDQKQIAPLFPLGSISIANFSNLGTLHLQGSWDGPKEIVNISLMVLDVDKKTTIVSMPVERLFQKDIALEDISLEYQAQLTYQNLVLQQIAISKPKLFQEYISMTKETPLWLENCDRAIQHLQQNKTEIGIQNLQIIQAKADYYRQVCQDLFPIARDKDRLPMLQKLYRGIFAFCKIVLDFKDRASPEQKKELVQALLQNRYPEMLEQFHLLRNTCQELPFLSGIHVLPYLQEQLQIYEKQRDLNKRMENIRECMQSQQYNLAIIMATDAFEKFPDVWQFLYVRYQAYRSLAQNQEFPQQQSLFQKKTNEDAEKLANLLQAKFQRLLLEKNYGEAYIVGSYLQQIKPEPSIQQKIEEIKSKVPLETIVDVYRQSLK